MISGLSSLTDDRLKAFDFLWLEITPKCNLTCTHCYADSSPRRSLRGSMVLSSWLDIIAQSAALGCRQLQFIGGEPTVHPDLDAMISFASESRYELIEVFTNATLLPKPRLKFFASRQVAIATSFYSADPTVHDQITQRPGSFMKTVAGITGALENGLRIRAGIIEMAANEGHADAARTFLRTLGVKNIKTDHQRGVGRGLVDLTKTPMSQLCGQCWRGKLCVTADRAIYPCVFAREFPVGAVDDSLTTVMEGAALSEFRTSYRDYWQRKVSISRPRAGDCVPDACHPSCSPCSPDDCYPSCSPCSPDSCHPSCSPCVPDQCHPSCSPCGPDSCGPSCSPCVPDSCDPVCVPGHNPYTPASSGRSLSQPRGCGRPAHFG